MKILFVMFGLGIFLNSSIAQNRLAVYKVEKPRNEMTSLDGVSSHIVSIYANDERFIVIDKANSYMIAREQDRQKNEEFIDGYIVEQGKQEGFDYCYYSKYLPAEKKLVIRLYDVAKGTVIANKNISVKTSLIGKPKGLFLDLDQAIADINERVFEVRTEVVRMTEDKKNKAKILLVATGYNQNAKPGQPYEIYQMVEEKVGDKVLLRKAVVGEGEIKEVEDGNFSNLKVTDGNAEVYTLLKAGKSLYLKHKK